MTFYFLILLASQRCNAATQTPVRVSNYLKSFGEEKLNVINIEQRDCSLIESEWAARCVLSRQLNFRQLNILGNVWKLNCEGEQREIAGMKRCGETQKHQSYMSIQTQIHTRTHQTHTWLVCQSVSIGGIHQQSFHIFLTFP